MSTTHPGTSTAITAAQFIENARGKHVELVKGEIREVPLPSPKHGKICATMVRLLGNYVAENDLGHVMSDDSFIQTRSAPDTVRGPDVSFYSYERLQKGELPEGLLDVAPELVVEVRSPSNGWNEIFVKIGEYLSAGVKVVIVLDAVTASASVYRRDELQQIIHNGDELVVPDVLPEFAIAVQTFFD